MATTLQLRTISVGGVAVSAAGVTLRLSSGFGTGGGGSVSGPGTVVANTLTRFSGTTGNAIKSAPPITIDDAGKVTRYPPGATADTAATNVAYAAIVPDGTLAYYDILRSWRPETLPNYGTAVSVTTNPSDTTPDVTCFTGWNVERVNTLPMCWRARECYYKPGSVRVMEDHVAESGWPANSYWKSNIPRRAISVETFETPGGGFGNLVNVGCDTDSFHLQSVSRRTVAEGGSGGPQGTFFKVTQSITDGSAVLNLISVATSFENDWYCQLHPAGYLLQQTSRSGGAWYMRTNNGPINIGDGSSGTVNLSGGTLATTTTTATFSKPVTPASSSDAAAPNNSIYYSTTANKLVYKDSGGTVNALY